MNDTETIIKALTNSLNLLKENEKMINDLNVFPVPDGDTGTNMRLTLEAGINAIKNETELKGLLENLKSGVLNGARGNSGVILSMIIKGVCKYLSDCDEITPANLLNAFKSAKEYVYRKMKNPVEGTILTVFRCSIDMEEPATLSELFEIMLDKAQKTLDDTPKMLKMLEDAGVVDSGGAGFVSIISGIVAYIKNENISSDIKNTEKTKIKYYNEYEHKPIAYVAFCVGEGIKEIYSDLGADVIILCPNTINPSAREIYTAVNEIDADYVIILPNNPNALLSTDMALNLLSRDNVYVLRTRSMAEGYFALSMMTRTSENFEYQFEKMKEGLEGVISIDIIRAIKAAKIDDVEINIGDYIAISNNHVVSKGENVLETFKRAINNLDLSDKEIMAIFAGRNADDSLKDAISEFMEEEYEDIEMGILDGDFENIELTIGIS